ncbi:MAG: TolC family protein [Candidatus Coatesbacteria bacterium]|nr:TolC family protein [Candidatus Coatesbacteria bacterium]
MLLRSFILVFFIAVALKAENISLKEAIEIALKKNATIKNDSLQVDVNSWAVIEAYTAMLPKIYLNQSYSKREKTNYTDAQREAARRAGTPLDEDTDYFTTSFSISQNLLSGTSLIDNVRLKKLQSESHTLQILIDRNEIVISVIESFIAISQAKAQIKSSEENIPRLKFLISLARERNRVGVGVDLELREAELQLLNEELSISEAKDELETAKDNLKRLLVFEFDKEIEIDDNEVLNFPRKELNLNNLLESREKILSQRKAYYAIRQAEINKSRAFGEHLPSLSANFSYSWPTDHTLNPDGNPTWQFSLNLSVPIFTSFATTAAYKQARIQLDQAEITYRDNVYGMKQTIITQYRNYERYKKRTELYKKIVEEASLVLNQRIEEYRIGKGTMREILDAYKDLVDKRLLYINNLYAGIKAYVDVIKIVSQEPIKL